MYVAADVPDCLATRADAACLAVGHDPVLSHDTAAMLRGLPVPATTQIHVTLPPDVRASRRPGVHSHQGIPSTVLIDGRRISAPAENFLELAESLSLVDLVILGDAMVRRGFVTCEVLLAAVASTRRRRGARLARQAAALVRPRVDSPMETRVRLLVMLAGLPEPSTNLVVRDEDGGWIGAVDLLYGAFKIAIEYHGDVHRSSPGKWRRDVAKAELLTRLDWVVIVLTADDIFVWPGRTLRRIHEALAKAGHPDIPIDLDPVWRNHLAERCIRPTPSGP